MSPKLWSAERSAVRDLYTRNPTHQGRLQAVEFIKSLMAQAVANERAFRGAEELARLARHSVAPLDVLIEVCALSLYLSTNIRAVPDQRSHDFAISAAVFGLAARPRRITRKPGTPWGVNVKPKANCSYSPKARCSALAFVGRHLRVTLAGLIANVSTSIASRDAQKAAFEESLLAPFSML